jgi:hypothetical protein
MEGLGSGEVLAFILCRLGLTDNCGADIPFQAN